MILEMNPSRATIKPIDGKLGSCQQEDANLFTEAGYREDVINCYAGRAAELKVGGSVRRARWGAEGDDETATDYIFGILGEDSSEEDRTALEREMREVTDSFVEEHWGLVDRLAKELLCCTSLGYDELSTLFEIWKTQRKGDGWRLNEDTFEPKAVKLDYEKTTDEDLEKMRTNLYNQKRLPEDSTWKPKG